MVHSAYIDNGKVYMLERRNRDLIQYATHINLCHSNPRESHCHLHRILMRYLEVSAFMRKRLQTTATESCCSLYI